jgi:hypothetical protein
LFQVRLGSTPSSSWRFCTSRGVLPDDCEGRTVAQDAHQAAHGRASARVCKFWIIGLAAVAFLALLCWYLAKPLAEVRSAVAQCPHPSDKSVLDWEAKAQEAIDQLGDRENAAARLSWYLRLPSWLAPRRPVAASMLGLCGTAAVPGLIEALGDEDAEVRTRAALALGDAAPHRAIGPLLVALHDREPSVRAMAACALRESRDPRVVQPLLGALGDEYHRVRFWAASSLALQSPRGVQPLLKALGDGDEHVRLIAAESLGKTGDSRAVEGLGKALERDVDPRVRAMAAWALGRIRDSRALDLLREALKDSDKDVRTKAQSAISEIERHANGTDARE